MSMLTTEQKKKIADSIEQSEKNTSGEFVAIIAAASDDYFYIPTLWAALLALAVPSVFELLDFDNGHMILSQFVVFIVIALMLRVPALKMLVIPKDVKQRRAHRHAREQFLLQNLHHTEERNGVMLFVSEAERYVEIIADKGINDVVENDAWNKIVTNFIAHVKDGNVTEGYLSAINDIETILKEHFPADGDNKNELPNHLVEVGYPD